MISNCRLIDIPEISDHRGSLSVLETNAIVPFDIKRIFYIYDVTPDEDRGEHAHKECEQFIICLKGSIDLEVDDGEKKVKYNLISPTQGVYIPKMIWATLKNFSTEAICLVLASDFFDESDYIRDYDKFISEVLLG